jgi:aminoglycoside phosphotransferase (APT) family kinase protein
MTSASDDPAANFEALTPTGQSGGAASKGGGRPRRPGVSAAMSQDVPGLPVVVLDPWLRESLPDVFGSQEWHAVLISGGLSNITYRLRVEDGRSVILRRPPLGGVLPSAHDMGREFRVLTALADTPVPVPAPLAFCADPDVLGSPFYVMRDVAGRVLRTRADTARLSPHERGVVADALISTLAALHAVEIDAVGLASYGRPEGYVVRQINRWATQWRASRTRELPDMDLLLTRLREGTPRRGDHAIVHGDFRLDNTIVDLNGGQPHIAAVIDWELSTLGDPLADLGMALTYWHDLGDSSRENIPIAVGVTAHEGFPTRRQLSQRYAGLTQRDLTELPFYLAFSSMKLAVILEGVRSRHASGHTVSAGYDEVGDPIPALVALGLSQLAVSRP